MVDKGRLLMRPPCASIDRDCDIILSGKEVVLDKRNFYSVMKAIYRLKEVI